MTRLVYVILISLPFVIYYILKSRYIVKHIERYTEEQRYKIAQRIVYIMKKNGRISTKVFGLENLPEEGGYVMYPNHQGRYDALGIIGAHKEPCSFLIDKKAARMPLANEFTGLLEGLRLDKTSLKAQLKTILKVAERVKDGKKFIVFPEGTYDNNKNTLLDFLPGAFTCSVRSETPIIPVALVDSHKVFGVNSLRRVKTEVHFLKPLTFEEYKEMTTIQIAELVHDRIDEVLQGAR